MVQNFAIGSEIPQTLFKKCLLTVNRLGPLKTTKGRRYESRMHGSRRAATPILFWALSQLPPPQKYKRKASGSHLQFCAHS